jgi:hypothetical protein
MELTEHIAAFLRANGFPDATSGAMPPEPDRAVTVYATGVRARRDEEGSRFQIIVRSEKGIDTALADAMQIMELLDDFSGITAIDSPYFGRIVAESGIAAMGEDSSRRLLYSLNFRVWYC